MDDEVQWYSQYDPLFLTFPPQPPPTLIEHLQLSSSDRQEWPTVPKLPELSKLFELLESFISDGRNWMKKRCSESEMSGIEEKLNTLMICLQCQKRYGNQFWNTQLRRIQASVIHAYIFLKMFVVALIPPTYGSLMHANSEEKLMTEVFKLENLINEWIQLMKPIHVFMHRKQFESEGQLTEAFFSELFQFFKGLPKIQKASMVKVPKLMELINVCLEIETCEEEIRSRGSSKSSASRGRGSSESERENNFMKRNVFDEEKKRDGLEFFKFDERVRVHTSFRKTKKLTITSLETKEKSQSNDKSRSPSLDRSLTIFESDRLKRGTLNESPNRDSSNPKVRSRILTSKTNHSDRSRERSRKKSVEEEAGEQERDVKIKKKKAVVLPVKLAHLSQQLNLERGSSRGWGILREYLNKKIAERKLRKLILL